MSLKQMMLERLEQIEGAPKKSLGQNFLINQNAVDSIVKKTLSFNCEQLYEVGPGLGALTESVLAMEQKPHLVEMDQKFASFWRERGCEVTEVDALKFPWDQHIKTTSVLMSNLPYQISARLVVELSAVSEQLLAMVLMFQKEVAQRITAQPGGKDYGFLSVVAQLAWDVSKVIDASPQDFYPPPKVTSRVLSFKRRRQLSVEQVQFTKKAFENRRKFMLKNFAEQSDSLANKLTEMGFNEKVRAEQLSPQQFDELYRAWSSH